MSKNFPSLLLTESEDELLYSIHTHFNYESDRYIRRFFEPTDATLEDVIVALLTTIHVNAFHHLDIKIANHTPLSDLAKRLLDSENKKDV